MNSLAIFDKPLHELSVNDLLMLRKVSEGWYVEYKERCNDIDAAAKSLSAFANSYGGWLFYGIRENSDGTRTAETFPGIAAADVAKVEEWLQQAARTRIVPSPFFEHRVLLGPDPTVGLAEDRAIMAVRVPMGNNPPYVHANGRIYRRIADASDPKAETDRHLLDLLWQRSWQAKQKFTDFVKRELPGHSPEEEHVPYVRLFFFLDPWNERGIRSTLSFKRFRDVMTASNSDQPSLPLDNFFTMSNGFVARQTKDNNPYYRVLTWQHYSNLTTEITIPLNRISLTPSAQLYSFMNTYGHGSNLVKLCNDCGLTSVHLIDLSQLYLILRCLLMRLFRVYEAENANGSIYVKANITGIWRHVPFIDLPSFSDHIQTCGIPVIQEDRCFAPDGTDPDSCLELEAHSQMEKCESDEQRRLVASTAHAMFITWQLGRAFGLPPAVFGFDEGMSDEDVSAAFKTFHAMEERLQKRKQMGSTG